MQNIRFLSQFSFQKLKQTQSRVCLFEAIIISLLLSCCLPALAAQLEATGFLQINTETDVQVSVDGKLNGKTSNTAYVIQGLTTGTHTVLLEKDGFQPTELQVKVPSNDVAVLEFRAFKPKVSVYQAGQATQQSTHAKTGALIIRTVPVECRITINGLKLTESDSKKTAPTWGVRDIPIGSYDIEVKAADHPRLFLRAEIIEGNEAMYLANLITQEVQDLKAEEKAVKKAQQEAAERQKQAQIIERQRLETAAQVERERQTALTEQARRQAEAAAMLEEKRIMFLDDLQQYDSIIRDMNPPLSERATLWQNLCKRWGVNPADGTRLMWRDGRVVVN